MTKLATICADQVQAQHQMSHLAKMERQYRVAAHGSFLPGFLKEQLRMAYDVQRVELDRCAGLLARAVAANDEPIPVGVA